MAIDFWKNGKVPAQSFNDSSLLTCISNDFGYEHIFAKPLDFFAEKKDVLFTISSSGKSKNILRAARVMSKKQGKIITLSGFAKDNPLRFKGVYNFYVPSCEYGLVEIIHQYICHFILDVIIDHNKYSNLKRGRK
jgi:D-sedoheptulose 7-phosphate isomerase